MIIYDVLKNEKGFLKYKIINNRAYIALLEVNRKYRNQGVGSNLLKQFESLEILKDVKTIYLRAYETDTGNNYNRLINFYSRNGYNSFSNDFKGIGLPFKKDLK